MTPLFYSSTRKIATLRNLPAVLEGSLKNLPCGAWDPRVAGIVGWGLKANAAKARQAAKRNAVDFITIEDGFIRSIGLGVGGAEPFGFVLDRRGIYYDARSPSELEDLLVSDPTPPPDAASLRRRLVELRASKYNHCWQIPMLPPSSRKRILLVDQTQGDLSVQLGLGDATCFATMLTAARESSCDLVVKLHPDVIAGKRRGYLAELDLTGCTVLADDCNPIELVLTVDEVYTVTSQLGFEALLAGRPVRCFGMPFYAGWGLTRDEQSCPRRSRSRSLDQVFWAAYGIYSRYADPLTGQCCTLTRILDLIATHRRISASPGKRLWAFGFSLRKQMRIRPWLPNHEVIFVDSHQQARRQGARADDGVLAWGMRNHEEAGHLAAHLGIPVSHMEDGFIRSVGLGSDLVPPRSLVYDMTGIYFDPRLPSDLETILNHHVFTTAERERGAALAGLLQTSRITKYNTGRQTELILPPAAAGRRIALVPGQVEDDQSILCGTSDIRTNQDLLCAARVADPTAFLIYKPHPDVLAGNRQQRAAETPTQWADLVVTEHDMATCLTVVDAVHTMTSLAGFEGLIHGKTVHTYGLPFYAGWGLTSDRQGSPRRERILELCELVYACLVLYPRYMDPTLGIFVAPEDVIHALSQQRKSMPSNYYNSSRLRHWTRQLLNFFK